MSGAPIISGTRKLPRPARIGTTTKKTIPVPCIVTTSLYAFPVITPPSAFASCVRIRSARKPESAKKKPAVAM